MAQSPATSTSTQRPECRSVKELLQEVTAELNRFEAKKLGDLKAELDAFVTQQDSLVADYAQKYPQLRDRWCTQHQQIVQLHSALLCAFPKQDWKELVKTCICTPQHENHCDELLIARRNRCSTGMRERARNRAQCSFNAAKARLDSLKTNATGIDAEITAADALIKQIQGLVSGPDQAVVLYLFWFKLLPPHLRLMPGDVSDECKRFGEGESPYQLCETVYQEECPPEEDACRPPQHEDADAALPQRHAAPWLVSPDRYGAELDCAWDDYHAAKDEFAKRESEFRSNPDDLASLTQALAARKAALDDTIRTCLKNAKPGDTCCTQSDARKSS
jgi:hypothetical protein